MIYSLIGIYSSNTSISTRISGIYSFNRYFRQNAATDRYLFLHKNTTDRYLFLHTTKKTQQAQQAHTISTSRFWLSLQASAQRSLQAAQRSHTRQLNAVFRQLNAVTPGRLNRCRERPISEWSLRNILLELHTNCMTGEESQKNGMISK